MNGTPMLFRPLSVLAACLFALPLAAEPVAVDYPEFPRETAALVAATEALFDAIEAETPADKPALQLKGLGAIIEPVSMDLPETSRRALRADLGALENLTAYNITWYPTDHLTGAVDFVGTWGNGRNLVCGYITWDLSGTDTPELVAMTTSYLDTSTLIGLPTDAAHGELLRANCAYGQIEPNLELVRLEELQLN